MIRYRDYVTTSLQLIPEKKRINTSYIELIGLVEPKEEVSGIEIANDIINRANLSFGD